MERTSEDAVAETDHADGTLEKRFTRVLLTVFLCVCVCVIVIRSPRASVLI